MKKWIILIVITNPYARLDYEAINSYTIEPTYKELDIEVVEPEPEEQTVELSPEFEKVLDHWDKYR